MITIVGINIWWKAERKVRLNQDHKGRVESQSGFVSKWRRLTSEQFCHFTVLPFCHCTVLPFFHFTVLPFSILLFFFHFTVLQFSFELCKSINLWQLKKSLLERSSKTVFLFLLSPQISVFVSKNCFSCHLRNAKFYFLISGAFQCNAKFICLPRQNTNDHTLVLALILTSTQFYRIKNVKEECF